MGIRSIGLFISDKCYNEKIEIINKKKEKKSLPDNRFVGSIVNKRVSN
jgi:hypothetical protein